MDLQPFDNQQFAAVVQALDIAEDEVGNYYKFSLGQWKRHRYDVKTLPSLSKQEISDHAFALLNKAESVRGKRLNGPGRGEAYFICLQDHQILKALKRDASLALLPLLVYILTHELIHIVRFCNFSQRYEASERDRDREERIVHGITYEILKKACLSHLDYILASYREHRMCEMGVVSS